MKQVVTSLLSLAMLAAAPLASQATGFGEGAPVGLTAPRSFKSIKADDGAFEKGNIMISAGVGIGNRLYADGGTLPFVGMLEYGISELGPGVLSLGVYGGYASQSIDILGFTAKATSLLIQPRLMFHYPVSSSFDVYGGAGLGFYRGTVETNVLGTPIKADANSTEFSVMAGAHYFFVPAFGLFAEAATNDFSYLKAGLSLKF